MLRLPFAAVAGAYKLLPGGRRCRHDDTLLFALFDTY